MKESHYVAITCFALVAAFTAGYVIPRHDSDKSSENDQIIADAQKCEAAGLAPKLTGYEYSSYRIVCQPVELNLRKQLELMTRFQEQIKPKGDAQ